MSIIYIPVHELSFFFTHTKTFLSLTNTNNSTNSYLNQNNIIGWSRAGSVLTGHVHHAAVTVVHQVARLAVDAACCDAVALKEV